MSKSIRDELKEIINLFGNAPESEQVDCLHKDEYFCRLKEKILQLDENSASDVIGWLKEDIGNKDLRYLKFRPYLSVFLSYAYTLLDIKYDALECAQEAISGPWPTGWDKALTYWFLGKVYSYTDYGKEARAELVTAQEKFEYYENDAANKLNYGREKECKEIIDRIKKEIKKLPSSKRVPNPRTQKGSEHVQHAQSEPAGDTSPGEQNRGNGDGNGGGNGDDNITEPVPSPQTTVSINMPVDIRSSDYLNQDLWQRQISAQATPQDLSSPLDVEFFQEPDNLDNVSASPTPSPSQTSSTPLRWRRSQLIFPVQSQIRAGTEGKFIFESQPDLDAILDELAFNDINHYFYNLREEGNPIILDPRVYRWFHIEGNSMNQATPVPVMDKDYILAIDINLSNRNAQIGDIVVAALHNPLQGERAGVLKKYTSKGLESRSSEEYPIISRRKASIRGVAIAVAKPHL